MFSMRLRISELIHSTEESNHGWELPVVVEEEALLRRARSRHGHLVELLGIWNGTFTFTPVAVEMRSGALFIPFIPSIM